jgi:hypothetical protein
LRCRSRRFAGAILGAGAAVFLSGCWTPPSASVRPSGEPRIVAGSIEAQGAVDSAEVESVDHAARTLVLSVSGVPMSYEVGRRVRHWSDLRPGDEVSATFKEALTVYIAPLREMRGPPHAHVLVVDPSYRLLQVQYANGGTTIFKVRLHTPMQGIEAGDAVTIVPGEVTELHLQRHANAVTVR